MTDSYDSVPYTSYAYAQTHPDTLCTLGRLFGLSPAAPTRCRVLELGCASGGNLIPMAELLPESEFVGIDRSRVQIDRGRALVGELGLDNVRLELGDIGRVDPQRIGSFDYVICHGVFAWVPRRIQDRILTLGSAVLRPHGLMYVSYNVYPGWHVKEMVRRMMLFHLRRHRDPRKQIEQARALLDFVATTVGRRSDDDDPHARLLAKELETIRAAPDTYLFHEYLERDNAPLYFHEFVDRLRHVPLRYLCDTDLNLMIPRDMPADVRETLERVAGDQVSMEQYLDFVRNRQFRTSVVCRIEAAPQRRLVPARIAKLRFTMAGAAKLPEPEPNTDPEVSPDARLAAALVDGVELGFECVSGAKISSPEALTKAALVELCERWPATLSFDELVEAARARVDAAGITIEARPDERERLAADLIECLLRKAVIARSWEPPLTTAIEERPRVAGFARLSADREGWIPSLHHFRIELAAPLQRLIPLLDGTRDRAALLAELARLAREGEVSFRTESGEPVASDELPAASAAFLDEQLDKLRTLPALLA